MQSTAYSALAWTRDSERMVAVGGVFEPQGSMGTSVLVSRGHDVVTTRRLSGVVTTGVQTYADNFRFETTEMRSDQEECYRQRRVLAEPATVVSSYSLPNCGESSRSNALTMDFDAVISGSPAVRWLGTRLPIRNQR
jgi:hypothetical protein